MSAYRAPWWLPGGHLQTVVAALAPAPRISWRRERWETPDGDFIELDWADGTHVVGWPTRAQRAFLDLP